MADNTVELIADNDVKGGPERRSGRAPKKPSQSYEDILEREDIVRSVAKIDRASKLAEAHGNAEEGESIDVDLTKQGKSSKKRNRGEVEEGYVSLTMPKEISVVLNSYSPCVMCHELLGLDVLSHCLDCCKYFHTLCLKDTTIPLNCSSCELTRDAINANPSYKNNEVLGEYNEMGPAAAAKHLFEYRMTLLHRYAHPDLHKHSKSKTSSTPSQVLVAATPSKASPKGKRRPKGKASAKGRSHKRKVPSVATPAIHVDEIEQDEEEEEQDANSFFDQTSIPVELPTKPKQTNAPPTDTAESTAKVDDMEPQQAPLHRHRRGSGDFTSFGEDVVKMEATARTGEPSADMKDFGGSIDVDLVPPPPHMALLTAPTPSPPPQVEDIPMLDNIMDDEQHAAVETETYESAWPAGMMFGDDAKEDDPDQTT